MTQTRRRPAAKLWPDLDELEVRRAQCAAQIDARVDVLRRRLGDSLELVAAEGSDIVLENLRLRLATYDVDIARMNEHELVSLAGDHHGEGKPGKVWSCVCKAYGNAPTAFGALSRFNEHVTEAVWGVAE